MKSISRHALAMATIAMFAWVGLTTLAIPLWDGTILGVQPALGHVLLALSALRLGVWVRGIVRSR
jgi:hypothetical protein